MTSNEDFLQKLTEGQQLEEDVVDILNYNEFCDKAFTADLPTILKSGNDAGRYVKSSGEVRYNVDSRTWNTYDGLDLTRILTDILRKEKIC